MRRWRIQGTVLTSGIAYEYPYSQHFKESINRKSTSAWRLCCSEQLAWFTLINSQQVHVCIVTCCLRISTCGYGQLEHRSMTGISNILVASYLVMVTQRCKFL